MARPALLDEGHEVGVWSDVGSSAGGIVNLILRRGAPSAPRLAASSRRRAAVSIDDELAVTSASSTPTSRERLLGTELCGCAM
mmetsp:Transcript_94079/g.302746  ORF Transcript_94079/g.302746 Transcript_94079/m.302746 type:complete len:83 (-) Transcript_94079:1213-1461(-)